MALCKRSDPGSTRRLRTLAALSLLAVACGQSADSDEAGVPPFEYDYVALQPRGPRPYFTFFVTSQAGLFGLKAGRWSPAPDPENGFGGNLGGLRGADEICTTLARQSNPGDTKIWRAFLSTYGFDGGKKVDAIDRIGRGPWYDFQGYQLGLDLEDLMPIDDHEGRPRGAAPGLADNFTVENGELVRPRLNLDNHDILTGSGKDGRLFDDAEGGRVATCEDWTSSELEGQSGNDFAGGGQVPVGHSWPRNNSEGRHWISEHTVNGCRPGVQTQGNAFAPTNDFRVGAAGGYGGFYCFALNATAPPTTGIAP